MCHNYNMWVHIVYQHSNCFFLHNYLYAAAHTHMDLVVSSLMNQPALESQSEHFSLEVIPQWSYYVSVKTINYVQRMQKVNRERLTSSLASTPGRSVSNWTLGIFQLRSIKEKSAWDRGY